MEEPKAKKEEVIDEEKTQERGRLVAPREKRVVNEIHDRKRAKECSTM